MTTSQATSASVPTGLGDQNVELSRVEAVARECLRYHRRLEPIRLIAYGVGGVFALGIWNFTGVMAAIAMIGGAVFGLPIYVIGQAILARHLRRGVLELGFSKIVAGRIVSTISEDHVTKKLVARTRQMQLKILADRVLLLLSEETP